MNFPVERLRAWTEVLCRNDGDTAAVLAELGFHGATIRDGWFTVEPSPPGTRSARGQVFAGTVESLTFDLVDGTGLYDGLYPAFPSSWDAGFDGRFPQEWMTYKLELPGAPYWCGVAVRFDAHAVFEGGVAQEVRLSRHRAYQPGEPRPGMAGMAAQLRSWSATICTIVDGDPPALAAAMGLTGTLTGRELTVEPPPPGIRQLSLDYRDGTLWSVAIALLDSTLTQAELEAEFGAGEQVPLLHSFHVYGLCFPTVTVPGAAHACSVFADLERPQHPSSVAVSVLLRRDRT